MSTEIPYYDSPIDVMYMIHNALRAEAAAVEERARHLSTADTLTAFAQAFLHWLRALETHADIEDTYMTPLLPARATVQDNEAEHKRLTTLLRDIASFLHAVPPQTPVSRRMQRQVLGQVITLALTTTEQQVLAELMARWAEQPPTSVAGSPQPVAPAARAVSQTV